MASVMAASVFRRTLLRRCVPMPYVSRGCVSRGYDSRRGYMVDPMQDPPKDRFEKPDTLRPEPERPLPELEKPPPDGISVLRSSLRIESQRGVTRNYLYTALRDSCQCPRCVDPHSKQRNIRTTDIPGQIKPRDIERGDDGQLRIKWTDDVPGFEDGHVSVYDRETLLNPVRRTQRGVTELRSRFLWDEAKMKDVQHWISYEDFMNDGAKFADAMRYLSLTGLIFVKDIPDSRDEVAKVATRMGPLRNTFYGSTWDVRSVPQATNVAYTHQTLDFHMDLMYMVDPPGYQLLHCLQNSCDGGESVFADALGAAHAMRRHFPEYFKTLTHFRVPYEYNHERAVYYNSWPVIELGTSHPYKLPSIKRVNYSPPFQAPMHTLPQFQGHKNGHNFTNAFKKFASMLNNPAFQFQLKLEPGQCVVFENRRVVHARRQFDVSSGYRWLAGAYVDTDSMHSTFRRAFRDHPDLRLHPRNLQKEHGNPSRSEKSETYEADP